jgi:hypothetical protein
MIIVGAPSEGGLLPVRCGATVASAPVPSSAPAETVCKRPQSRVAKMMFQERPSAS